MLHPWINKPKRKGKRFVSMALGENHQIPNDFNDVPWETPIVECQECGRVIEDRLCECGAANQTPRKHFGVASDWMAGPYIGKGDAPPSGRARLTPEHPELQKSEPHPPRREPEPEEMSSPINLPEPVKKPAAVRKPTVLRFTAPLHVPAYVYSISIAYLLARINFLDKQLAGDRAHLTRPADDLRRELEMLRTELLRRNPQPVFFPPDRLREAVLERTQNPSEKLRARRDFLERCLGQSPPISIPREEVQYELDAIHAEMRRREFPSRERPMPCG